MPGFLVLLAIIYLYLEQRKEDQWFKKHPIEDWEKHFFEEPNPLE